MVSDSTTIGAPFAPVIIPTVNVKAPSAATTPPAIVATPAADNKTQPAASATTPPVVKTLPVPEKNQSPALQKESPKLVKNKLSIIDYEGEVIQICTVKTKSEAFETLKKIEKVSERLAIIVHEGDYYKVRISGFANREIASQYASNLSKSWFESLYIPDIKPNVSIQVGEFSSEIEALFAQKKRAMTTVKNVIIVYQNELYKVRIPEFANIEEASDFASKLE